MPQRLGAARAGQCRALHSAHARMHTHTACLSRALELEQRLRKRRVLLLAPAIRQRVSSGRCTRRVHEVERTLASKKAFGSADFPVAGPRILATQHAKNRVRIVSSSFAAAGEIAHKTTTCPVPSKAFLSSLVSLLSRYCGGGPRDVEFGPRSLSMLTTVRSVNSPPVFRFAIALLSISFLSESFAGSTPPETIRGAAAPCVCAPFF
eukprot:2210425-Rhodomonas_salina.2